MAPKTAQIIKPGKVVILLNGRYAGAKVIREAAQLPPYLSSLSSPRFCAVFYHTTSIAHFPRASHQHPFPTPILVCTRRHSPHGVFRPPSSRHLTKAPSPAASASVSFIPSPCGQLTVPQVWLRHRCRCAQGPPQGHQEEERFQGEHTIPFSRPPPPCPASADVYFRSRSAAG